MKGLKKFTVLILFILPTIIGVKAQTFTINDKVINLGIGAGYVWSVDGSVWPAFNLSFEKGIKNIEDIGVLSIGGTAGFQHAYFKNLSWTDFIFGARFAFHLNALNIENFDAYGGIPVGLRFFSKVEYDPYEKVKGYVGPYLGLFIGARYYFDKKFGIFCEIGHDISWFKVGVSLKI